MADLNILEWCLIGLLILFAVTFWLMEQGYVFKIKCQHCGAHTKPGFDSRWQTFSKGSTSETCHEVWAHDCNSDGEYRD